MNIWYCVECGNYLFSEPQTEKFKRARTPLTCPLCKTMSVIEFREQNERLQAFVADTVIEFPSMRFDDPRPQYRPLNYLIEAFVRARHFIHLVTESIDAFFLGMLGMKFYESDIEIRVIVWHPQKLYQQLDRLWHSSIMLKGYRSTERLLTRGILIETMSEAHQKLIIIDGCIAFKGSANTTLAGWTRRGEIIEFSTDRSDIRDLNRTFFAEFMARKRLGCMRKDS